MAASEGKIAVAELLIERRADPNPVDRWGGTPLDDALRHSHDRVARFLVAGAGGKRGVQVRPPAEAGAS